MERSVLRAEPQEVAVVGDHLLQAAPVLRLVHLAQPDVQRTQGGRGMNSRLIAQVGSSRLRESAQPVQLPVHFSGLPLLAGNSFPGCLRCPATDRS
jgi:hypothetical protein